jgi:tetratricopeptide (TPR) repeat protein
LSSHKKHKFSKPAAAWPDLKPRIERAVAEGRFQQALELAKQLHKYEPTPEHLELLKRVYLGRGRQLYDQGKTNDARTVFDAAQRIDAGNPAWVTQLAGELARAGGGKQALAMLGQVEAAAPPSPKLLAQAVDGAMHQEAAGRSLVPEALLPEYDRILTAFKQVEAGKDEEARATLQGIGLRSPFMEWKVLLRGFQAYYANDDLRALENWQRLDPERLPSRLAAPFRAQIDKAYRGAQQPKTQAVLQKQFDRLQHSPALRQVRELRTALARREFLGPVFRQLEVLVPVLRQEAPDLVKRLSTCLYWSILETGPDDMHRYQRVFGAPPEDPHLNRLQALAYERGHDLAEAHKFWQKYEKDIANLPGVFPADHADRARALVWLHMGQNAASIPSGKVLKRLPRFLREMEDQPRPLNPPADKCFQHSLELAPDQLEAHAALFNYHLREERDATALKIGQALLKRFPNHLPTLETMAEVHQKREENTQALDLLLRALKNNPLDRDLRFRVSIAHMLVAREHTLKKKFEDARTHYQAALNFADDRNYRATILGRWAAAEIKADDLPRSEELLQQTRSLSDSKLLITYLMLTEVHRLKLDKKYKAQYDKELKDGLAAPATGADAAAVADWMVGLLKSDVTYTGQKTHTKSILTYADKVIKDWDLTEAQAESLCRALLALAERRRSLTRLFEKAENVFPNNPYFPYLAAMREMRQGPYFNTWYVRARLEEARHRAQALPPDDKKKELLDLITKGLQGLEVMNPFNSFFGSFDFFGEDDEYDDD